MPIPIAKFEVGFIDDPFLRISLNIYCCGCWHNCPGCQNADLQNPNSPYCKKMTVGEVESQIFYHLSLVDSVVYLGGDFCYYLPWYFEISRYAKQHNLCNVLYTGFLLEDLPKKYLTYTDVVIDGKWDETKRQNKFPASSNQRVWVMKLGEFVLVDPDTLPINTHKE